MTDQSKMVLTKPVRESLRISVDPKPNGVHLKIGSQKYFIESAAGYLLSDALVDALDTQATRGKPTLDSSARVFSTQ